MALSPDPGRFVALTEQAHVQERAANAERRRRRADVPAVPAAMFFKSPLYERELKLPRRLIEADRATTDITRPATEIPRGARGR